MYPVEHYTCLTDSWEFSLSDTGVIYSGMATQHARKKVPRIHPTDETGPWLKRLRLSNEMVVAIIVGILALNVAYFGYLRDTPLGVSHFFSPSVDWNQRRGSVRDAFVESWEGYFRDAWGVFSSFPCGLRCL